MKTQDKDAAIQVTAVMAAGALLIYAMYRVGPFVLANPWVVVVALAAVMLGLFKMFRKGA